MSVRGGGKKEERGRNPPSRHLWVGNLPLGISERELADRFLRFGELESVAFQPARSYAFLNFKHDEDAFAAIDSLQGFPLNGNPLKIEFAKPEKSSTGSRTENIYRHDEQRSAARGSPFFQKDSRMRYESPDTYSRSNKMSDRDAEPSEVLYIGFPASLKVDEALLMEVFSPFGDITKVTIFPGRSYAFVQFRNLMAACKAKETLQGKLFGNPRVHISFAKSEPSSSSSGRGPSGRSLSPPYRSVDRLGSSEGYFHQDRNYGSINRVSSVRDPHYLADRDLEESENYMFNRKRASRNEYDGGPPYRRSRSPRKLPHGMYEYHGSSREMGSTFRDDPHRFPSRSSVYEEPRGLSEEEYYYQDAKRVKTRSAQPERQLPGHLISGLEQEGRPFSRASADFPPNKAFERNYEAGQLRYKQAVEKTLNLDIRNGEKSSFREPYDELMGAFSLPEGKRHTLEQNRPSLKDWNWEGTLAKGGNPICRAKCFPVGKAMDMMLPEFLDCTARTGLDMLANHYYQSSQAWVVFFVPGSDADIVFYNEFMHYLEEKQRAAVSKLDDTTTLFLVPPSDFSEKVLKVPGKLSISGVILRSEYGSSGYGPVQQQGERRYGETSYREDSGAVPDPGPTAFLRSAPRDVQHSPLDPYIESRHDQYSGMDWPPRDVPVTSTRSTQLQLPMIDLQGHSGFVPQQNADPSRFRETETPPGFQPEQLTHLASSVSRQQYQVDNTSNQPERYAGDARASFHSLPQVQTPSAPPGYQNVQLQGSSNIQEEGENEANPQKRLQATLQLAAALLQQIQQSKN